jgi:hypothetical protein
VLFSLYKYCLLLKATNPDIKAEWLEGQMLTMIQDNI